MGGVNILSEDYQKIMSVYKRRQDIKEKEYRIRKEKIFKEVEGLEELQNKWLLALKKLTHISLQKNANKQDLEKMRAYCIKLKNDKSRLLKSYGYTDEDLLRQYFCNTCKDTGFHDGVYCKCFEDLRVELLYAKTNIKKILEVENFDTFNLKYYRDYESKRLAGLAHTKCMQFIKDFDNASNLYIYGQTGTGKSFLTNCVMNEIIKSGKSVFYFSSIKLFDTIRKLVVRDEPSSYSFDDLYNSDLLVIDDLGTEKISEFNCNYLLEILNERRYSNKRIIITTNLDFEDLKLCYNERILSRILGNFSAIKLIGEDIRRIARIN